MYSSRKWESISKTFIRISCCRSDLKRGHAALRGGIANLSVLTKPPLMAGVALGGQRTTHAGPPRRAPGHPGGESNRGSSRAVQLRQCRFKVVQSSVTNFTTHWWCCAPTSAPGVLVCGYVAEGEASSAISAIYVPRMTLARVLSTTSLGVR